MYALVRSVKNFPTPFEDVDRIVQYWFFYNYDSFDRLWVSQWHQADWEQVTVGLAGGTPRFVAYSSHCFGSVLTWENAHVGMRTHPMVYVATGTHANYPHKITAPLRGTKCFNAPPPTYLGAAGLGFGILESHGEVEPPADYAFNETDRTGDNARQIPVTFVPEDGHKALINFVGAWGLDNNLSIGKKKPFFLGDGPNSPTDHQEWKDPRAGILCNKIWYRPKALRDGCKAMLTRS